MPCFSHIPPIFAGRLNLQWASILATRMPPHYVGPKWLNLLLLVWAAWNLLIRAGHRPVLFRDLTFLPAGAAARLSIGSVRNSRALGGLICLKVCRPVGPAEIVVFHRSGSVLWPDIGALVQRTILFSQDDCWRCCRSSPFLSADICRAQ